MLWTLLLLGASVIHKHVFILGKYGTAVMTYFRFIKWLMFLNLYIMVIMFCVITVPYLALGPRTFNESLPNPNVTGYTEAISCTAEYETFHEEIRKNETVALLVLDFVQGTVSGSCYILLLYLMLISSNLIGQLAGWQYINITFFTGWHCRLSPRGNIVNRGGAKVDNAFRGVTIYYVTP